MWFFQTLNFKQVSEKNNSREKRYETGGGSDSDIRSCNRSARVRGRKFGHMGSVQEWIQDATRIMFQTGIFSNLMPTT